MADKKRTEVAYLTLLADIHFYFVFAMSLVQLVLFALFGLSSDLLVY